jgi:hypothetical protein
MAKTFPRRPAPTIMGITAKFIDRKQRAGYIAHFIKGDSHFQKRLPPLVKWNEKMNGLTEKNFLPLDAEEAELMASIERDEWRPVVNQEKELAKAQQAARNSLKLAGSLVAQRRGAQV